MSAMDGSSGHGPPPSGAGGVTSLESQETTVTNPIPATSLNVLFRHSGWMPVRKLIDAAFVRVGVSASRQDRFRCCGEGAWIQESAIDPSRHRLRASHCHDRLCMPCANARAWQMRTAVTALTKDKPISFITLTLCGKNSGLSALVDKLYKSFRALRRHPLWSDAVQGGAAFLEIKWSDKAQRWHPHLHILADARYMDQGQLSTVWRTITGDSFIVDIRKVKDHDHAVAYVTKYASKPLDMSFVKSPKQLDEAIVALKGRRLCTAFGTWYRGPLSKLNDEEYADDEVDAGEWINMWPLQNIVALANAGDASALTILESAGVKSKWQAMCVASICTPPPS
jgi:hypothetical protein